MPNLPDVKEESKIVGCPLPERRFGNGINYVQYGVYQLAARYCGLRSAPGAFRGEWQHGWHPPDWNFHPEAVTGASGLTLHGRDTRIFLVARKDQEEYLKSQGYRFVHSVGLPIVYQRPVEIKRVPGSLLVMPVHSLDYTKHQWNFEQYAGEINAIRDRFSSVVVCVSSACYRRGYWIKAFQEYGFPIVTGADPGDANSYPRLATLFGRFDFMTTNGDGSHIVYAALFGARVSIYGTIAPRSVEDYEDDRFYQNNPDVLIKSLEMRTPEALSRRFTNLFCLPWEAPSSQEWGAFQAGMQCKRDPGELKHLLGWNQQNVSLIAGLQKIAGKSIQFAGRLKNPDEYTKAIAVAKLKEARPGDQVRVNGSLHILESLNGPLLAWELEHYYEGNDYRVLINPPDAPAVDLAPREGVSVLALAKHHPFRKIFYLQDHTEEAAHLRKNLDSEVVRNPGRLVALHYPHESMTSGSYSSLYDGPDWDVFYESFKEVFKAATVLRMSIDSVCWGKAADRLQCFPRCRLLLLECRDNPENYIGYVLARLHDMHFIPQLDLIRVGSVQWHPWSPSGQRLLSVVCTRSGLKISSSIV